MTNTLDQAKGTRGKLLDAAVELIAEVGWAAVTSRGVAERAGVNNGVVHYHFGSMDELRRAAAMHGLSAVFAGALDNFFAAPTTADALVGLTGALRAVDMASPPAVVTLEAMLHAPRDPEVARLVRETLEPFRAAMRHKLQHDRDAGRLAAAVDVPGLAVALTAALDGLMLHAMVEPDLDIGAATRAVTALLGPGSAPTVHTPTAHATHRRRPSSASSASSVSSPEATA
jgi:AcrR family transcriptional regulator